VRTFDDRVTAQIEEQMRRIATQTAAAHGAEATGQFQLELSADREPRGRSRVRGARDGRHRRRDHVVRAIEPTMGAEDFAFMLKARPGAYVFIGNGNGDHRLAGHGLGPCMLHNTSYDFNDELIPLGATFWVRLVEKFLAR
jgi:metal-dependent amidase/aminoacylase/carboxypeptidase family protein